MAAFRPVSAGFLVALALSSPVYAGQTGTGQTGSATTQGTAKPADPTQKPAAKPADPTQKPAPKPDDPQITRKEDVVVSASKTEQQLVDAPVTMTVINSQTLALSPSANYADILRNVPGTSVSQISARDININQRGATSSLATGQLTVVDGRSVYLDFFGFTMWEFVPNDLDQIKQIEVIRGPASAVWGANALTGVVSFITKTPREMAGESMTFGIGSFNTDLNHNGAENGTMFYARGTYAQAVNDRWAYKINAGYYDTDALARPTGLIPNGGTTAYPSFTNEGTQQPRFDARVDYDFADGIGKLVMSGGYGTTSGMMNTGIGPFRIEKGASLGYWQATYTRKAMRLQTFMNILDGSATNVVSVDPTGQPVNLTFAPKTFDVEFGDTHLLGTHNALTYGGNVRLNRFELSIAPGENSRNEGGGYIQDELIVNDHMRIVAGGRVDKFSSIDHAVFSPRVAVVFKPTTDQSIRVSYNRAYRAPSMVNNHLDTVVATPLPLGLVNPAFGNAVFYVPTAAVGNPDLKEESVDAYELAYTGYVGKRSLVTAAVYYTKYKDGIYFTETGIWTTAPPGFPGLGPFPPNAIWAGLLAQGIVFPSGYTYSNLGTVENKGVEVGLDSMLNQTFAAFINYAYQSEPIPSFPNLTHDQALQEINLPSKHQVNAGLTWNTAHVFGQVSVSHASDAFWQDVLDARYHGATKPYTSVNGAFGVKFQGGRYMASVRATNLGNQQIQQHIFGDVIKRQVVGEFKVSLK
jgi:outer membrane receptor protein involved in Fe transport